MRLPFFRPKSVAGGGAERPERGVDDPRALRVARAQARRRLMGAVVLLLAAVVGFPLLFETQPRPLPGSPAIDGSGLLMKGDPAGREGGAEAVAARTATPAKTAASAAVVTAVVAAATATAAATSPAVPPATPPATSPAAPPAAPPAAAVTTAKAAAPTSTAALAASAASAAGKAVVAKKADTPASAPKAAPAKPARAEAVPAVAAAASAPPQAALQAATQAATVRWVVQVGAYNDMERMRQARQKAEKLGFKTYITDVDSPTGKRTRVRLGPFATKKEADAAADKVKANGMAANVLSV